MRSLCSSVLAIVRVATVAGAAAAQTSEPPPVLNEVAWGADPLDLVTLTIGDPPPFPEPYRGYRVDGAVIEEQIRVYGTVDVSIIDQDGSGNNCGDRYWAIRWRSLNSDVPIIATAFFEASEYEWVSSDLQLLPRRRGRADRRALVHGPRVLSCRWRPIAP